MTDQEKVLNNIDMLVKMSGSKSDEESLKIELSNLNERITNLQNSISTLKMNTDDLYYDELKRAQDQTFEIQLRKSIQSLRSELRDKELELDRLKEKEAQKNEALESVNATLESFHETIDSIKSRMDEVSEEESKTYYDSSLKLTEENLANEQRRKDVLAIEYQNIQNDIIAVSDQYERIKMDIARAEENLNEVQENLNNSQSYIDATRKNSDNERISQLENELKGLESRRLEIVSDPIMIASSARKALMENDKITALNKISELERIVENVPYLNVEDKDSLQDEIKKAEKARDEFYESIAGKDYTKRDEVLDARIEFLNKYISILEKEKEELEEKRRKIDNDELFGINSEIAKVTTSVNELEQDIKKYEEAIASAAE